MEVGEEICETKGKALKAFLGKWRFPGEGDFCAEYWSMCKSVYGRKGAEVAGHSWGEENSNEQRPGWFGHHSFRRAPLGMIALKNKSLKNTQ